MDRRWIVYYANYNGIEVEYVEGYNINNAIDKARNNRGIQD